MRPLIWFRADLRVRDNTALAAACARSTRGAIGVFLISGEQWRRHDWACVKVEFLLRTLRVLSKDLARLNIPLLIATAPTFADAPGVLLEVARRHECDELHFNKEYEVNEATRDSSVTRVFVGANRRVFSHTDQVLVEPGLVRTGEGRFYTVFTPFRTALFRVLADKGVRAVPDARRVEACGVASSAVPDTVDGFGSQVPAELWPGGEHEAARRLDRFIESGLRAYKDRRDFPGMNGTSTLSAYLCVGAISPRACVRAAMDANGGRLDSGSAGASTWISEIVWREFAKHILVGFPRVSMHRAFRVETERLPWSRNQEHFDAWRSGRTGVPIVDAAMRCLHSTGWMHNRLRMIVAMYLTKDLFIDWRWGERHFMQSLVDGDLGPNNAGWQWSASTGTDAAPYFRVFNPVTQSRRFDPDGGFIRRWVPELAELEGGEHGAIHDPSELPPLRLAALAYPAPLVDRAVSLRRVKESFAALSSGAPARPG